jgi:urease accessory protein
MNATAWHTARSMSARQEHVMKNQAGPGREEMVARTWPALSCLVLFIMAVPSPAYAHMMNTGFGPFYDGLTHLFVTPEDLLPAIALALFAGLRGPAAGRAVLWALPPAWLTGCSVVAAAAGVVATTPAVSGVTTFLAGALVAADLPLPIAAAGSVALALGLVSGAVNGVELANAPAMTAAGIAAALFVLVALVAGHAASIRAPWARIAIRVAGSWIAAIGLLTLGWSLRAQ